MKVASALVNRPASWFVALALAALAVDAPVALADTTEQEEYERKKKEREAAEKARATAEVRESEEQREARERIEKKEANVKAARAKFAAAAQAAAKRQNDKGLEYMEQAWLLDPTNMDYPLNSAQFARALNKTELEFKALAAVKVLAKKNLATLDAAAPKRGYFEEELANANLRLETLRGKLSTGLLKVTVDPPVCEIFIEGAFAGIGTGEMDTITGQRKIETRCIGYHDFEKFESVREGDPTATKMKPTPIPYFGKLVVKVSEADGVTVYLDDVPAQQRVGEKPTKEGAITGAGTKEQPFVLAARKWIIRFQKEGFDRWHRRIDVRRDQVVVVEATLESLAQLDGSGPEKPEPGAKPGAAPGTAGDKTPEKAAPAAPK
ncbi:MAG: hypothetical protein FJ100_11670 [Deltaproteobacteria bacterium]|nr:hypothetical protein [Deltaproteobacteria bacterium]